MGQGAACAWRIGFCGVSLYISFGQLLSFVAAYKVSTLQYHRRMQPTPSASDEPAGLHNVSQFERSMGLPGGRRLVLTWARSPVAFARVEEIFLVRPRVDITQAYGHGHTLMATQITIGPLALTLLHKRSGADEAATASSSSEPTSKPPRSRSTLIGTRRITLQNAARPFGFPSNGMAAVVRLELCTIHLQHAPITSKAFAKRVVIGRSALWIHREFPGSRRSDPGQDSA